MLKRVGSTEKIPDFIEGVKGGKEKLMGFGHRVYKNYDPRATIIKKACDDVFDVTGVNPLLEIAMELEKIALEDEYFVKRKLYPNVDFYSGLIYEALQFPPEMFTVLFAIGRDPGLASPVVGAGGGQGAEDRPAEADLHGHAQPGLRADRSALISWGGTDANCADAPSSSAATTKPYCARSCVVIAVTAAHVGGSGRSYTPRT